MDLRQRQLRQNTVIYAYFKNKLRFGGLTKKSVKLSNLKLASKSLVFDEVATKHAKKLEKRVHTFLQKHHTKSDALRWVTLLDSVVGLNIDQVLQRVKLTNIRLAQIMKSLGQVHMIGAFELEIVNFEFNKLHQTQLTKKTLDEGTKNKITVLNSLGSTTSDDEFNISISVAAKGSKVLVHFHALVDFGKDTESNIQEFKKAVSSYSEWSIDRTQLHMAPLHSTKPFHQNIKILCQYMTKSGNEELRYKIFYGRDSDNTTLHEMEAAIHRTPFDSSQLTEYARKKLRGAMFDVIAYENIRSLTYGEVRFLNEATYALMKSCRKSTSEGYLILL